MEAKLPVPGDASAVDTFAVDTSAADTSAVDTSAVDTSAVDTSAVDMSAVDMSAGGMSVQAMAAEYLSAENCGFGHGVQSLALLALCSQELFWQKRACAIEPEETVVVCEPFLKKLLKGAVISTQED